ncbi:hypothetical protein [Allgaiera indica]|uniref:hypothetical protein n=1 Tax=Allgaiera indica TaxID=765699 RepID=UPI00115FF7EE|nr:hypothetical protein [Allgaiera indica]
MARHDIAAHNRDATYAIFFTFVIKITGLPFGQRAIDDLEGRERLINSLAASCRFCAYIRHLYRNDSGARGFKLCQTNRTDLLGLPYNHPGIDRLWADVQNGRIHSKGRWRPKISACNVDAWRIFPCAQSAGCAAACVVEQNQRYNFAPVFVKVVVTRIRFQAA